MARYTGPKNRLSRRENIDLGLKTAGTNGHARLLRRLNVPPGQHGAKGRRKISSYGLQLREKQRAKTMYGVMERQFRRYFSQAIKKRGATGEVLLQLLETRLDNVVYRLGFAPTRAAARQLVSHGHVRINTKKVQIPSYQVSEDAIVSLKEKSMEMPVVKELLANKEPLIPAWLSRQGPVGKVIGLPKRQDIDVLLNEQLIVEFYSR